MLYRLSKLIPVPMRSRYGYSLTASAGGEMLPPVNAWQTSTWWQWRGHVWRHRVRPA